MNNKLNNLLNDFFSSNEGMSDEDLNKEMKKFLEKYNSGEIEYENTVLDDAYEKLEEASNTKSKSKAIKLAKEAYDICPACFDAVLFLVNLEEDVFKAFKMLEEGLTFEKDRLAQDGFFENNNIGCFYGIFETRPYIRGLYMKASMLCYLGKFRLAVEVCQEILKLNNNDNTGARYLLMALYALLEEEKSVQKLYKKYPEEHLEMLFPLFALYYKLGDDEKAQEYLRLIDRANPSFVSFFKGDMDLEEDIPEGYYSKGAASEVAMYMQTYSFLLFTMGDIQKYILSNLRKKKNN